MTVELEMLNEENGRLRRHIKTLEAELRKQDAAQAQAEDLRGVSDAQGQGSVPVSAHTTGESSGPPTNTQIEAAYEAGAGRVEVLQKLLRGIRQIYCCNRCA